MTKTVSDKPKCKHVIGAMCRVMRSMSIEHPKPHECDGYDENCPVYRKLYRPSEQEEHNAV
jgi:hypothetical protein